MTLTGRSRILALGLAGILSLGVMGAGIAAADDGDSTPAADAAAQHPRAARHLLKGVLHSIVDNSGLDPQVFRQGFQDGKSINQVLADNGVDSSQVQAAVLDDVKAKLDELVANQALTQEQADAIYSGTAEHLPTLMDRVPDPDRPHHPGRRVAQGIRSLLSSAADALGMEPRDLGQRLRNGDTIANVADEQGIAVDDVIAAMTADANGHIDEAVANGRIDEQKGEELKTNIASRIERFVTEGRAPKE